MERRTHETPMDFEWQNDGPADPTSPFYQFTKRHGQRRGFDSPTKVASPAKSIFATGSSSPSKAGSFANPPATPSATPFRNPAFTTPRRTFDLDPFSEASGAESSPAEPIDIDTPIDTPEQQVTSRERDDDLTMTAASHKKPLFGRYGINFLGNSPGRGEIRRGRYADAVVHKVRKRKRVERDAALVRGRRDSYPSDSDSEDSQNYRKEKSKRKNGESARPGWFSNLLSGIESRPTLPHILSYYPQVMLNYFLAFFFIYVVYVVVQAIKTDIDMRSETEVQAVVAEMQACAKSYVENKCQPDLRVPAMEAICNNWEQCMNRDPNQVGRARVSAHTFGVIITSFIEPISYKAMFFFALLFACAIAVPNIGFRLLSEKTAPISQQPPQASMPAQWYPQPDGSQEYPWGIPQTPRHPSQEYIGGVASPFPALMPSRTPGRMSPRKGDWH